MKNLFYLMVPLLLIGCKTKTVAVEKSTETFKENHTKHFDSLIQLFVKNQLQHQKSQSVITSSLFLKSIPVLDSLGNRKPLNYKHYVDGVLKEEIYLEGGEINQETETKQTAESEHKVETKAENTKIESDVRQKKEIKKSSKKKDKTVKLTGFQFGFYLGLLLIIIVALVLIWILKKLKLNGLNHFKTKGG